MAMFGAVVVGGVVSFGCVRCLPRRQESPYLCAKFSGKGLFAFRSYRYVKADGTVGTSQHITITELGKKYIYDNYVSPAKAAKAAKEEQI